MEHDKSHHPRDRNARKMTPDGLAERSENIGDTSRENFNLRSERRDPLEPHKQSDAALQSRLTQGEDKRDSAMASPRTAASEQSVRQRDRASREVSTSVHETITQHKKQAQQFTEHAAQPIPEQKLEITSGGSSPPQQDTGSAVTDALPVEAPDSSHSRPTSEKDSNRVSADIPHDKKQKLNFTHDNRPLVTDIADNGMPEKQSAAAPAADLEFRPKKRSKKRRKRSKKQRQSFEKARTDKQDTPQIMDTTSAEPMRDSRTPVEQQTQQAEELPADSSVQTQDVALSHEHIPHSAPDRPGRLIFDRAPSTSTKTKRKTPPIPDAAKPNNAEVSADSDGPPQKTTDPQGNPVDTSSDAVKSNGADVENAGAAAEEKPAKKPGKLQFAEDEKPPLAPDSAKPDNKKADRKLEKARNKAGRSAEKLDKTQKKLPKKRKITFDKTFDEKDAGASGTDKPKRKLRFETEDGGRLPVKSQREYLKGPRVIRPVKLSANAAIGYAHKKILQVEHENVGTQAAHKAELLAEGGLRKAYRMHKTAPYRKAERLKCKTTKLNMKADYKLVLRDNPKLKSNLLSRAAQKHKIKRQYAKAAREAKKAAKRAKKSGDVIGKAAAAVGRFVARHPIVFGIIAALFLLVILISSVFTSCSQIASNAGTAVMATSYLAEDADVDNAELIYTGWEADLHFELGRAESDRPGYNEYRYDVGDISHNPYELMAFLTAAYHDFSGADVEAALQQIFAEQYQLTFTSSVETRYREGADGEQEAYDWNVLTVTLTARSFSDCVFSRMTSEQQQIYTLLMQSKGNRMYAGSPFDFNWLPYVSSYYGYRVHPTSGAKNYHKGIDIAVPTGTDIHAGHDGTVTAAEYAGDYGYVVVIEDGKGLVTKYAHCDTLLVNAGQTVKKGDVIAKSGNTGNSTGPHLHFEVIRNGQYLNPLYFAETNDTGTAPVFGDAGSPLGDGSYAALIAEAERHLGKAYVYGANGPANFDCSSYVCWIFTYSGIKNMPRTTAYGIYTQYCDPIPASEAQSGDVIFFHSTYSTTSPISHVGLYVGGGMMIHAGNPIKYTSINTAYWQQHFYSYGRVKP